MSPFYLMADNYVIINQVMYDSPLNEKVTTPPFSNGEFIELYNGSNAAVSLNGWYITGESPSERFNMPNISIASQSYVVVYFRHANSQDFSFENAYAPITANANVSYYSQNSVVLANQGETITLYNANNEIADQIYYDGTSHPTDPERLYATNQDSIPFLQCVSLHRTWVEFDENGLVVSGTSKWKAGIVSFGECQLAETTFGEHQLIGTQPLPTGANYILSVTPLDPTTRITVSGTGASVSNGVRTQTSIRYFDGLGRQDEIIMMDATPGKQDLVSMFSYDGRRNLHTQGLPIPMETEGQRIETSDAPDYYSDYRPYAEYGYENSAISRLVMQRHPGNAFEEDHDSKQRYEFNSENDQVRKYTVDEYGNLCVNSSCYAAYTLYKHSFIDEDEKSVIVYTDKLGRKVMEKRADNETYYVYDELGRLRFVLPCIPSSKLNSGSYALTYSVLQSAAYCYQYDSLGNMIYKRLPGCSPQYMVYDQIGQLVLKQDGNQRSYNRWTMFAYDSIGRNLYTAEITQTLSHAELISLFANKWQVEHYGNNPSHIALPGTGYGSTILGKKNILRLLSVNYYDDYDYLRWLSTPVRQHLRFEQEPGYGLKYENTAGLLTGSRVYNLSEEGYTATAYYYDADGRVIQSRSTCNAGGYTTTNTEYLFDGSIAQQLIVQGSDESPIHEHYRNTYDHAGRKMETRYQLNNEPEIILSAFSYDTIGRLVRNLLYNNMDTIWYSYDMRNMLTETRHRHFSERLYYADSLSSMPAATACYNGNISAMRITQGDTAFTFYYTYDTQNRLVESEQDRNGQKVPNEWFQYDARGNITALHRYCGPRLMDELTFSYQEDGNQLLSVLDYGLDVDRNSIIEYQNLHNATTNSPDMLYDANGNLIFDADRGISVIHYNILNLPDTIQFVNGDQIVNLYDATGRKYKSVVFTVPSTAVVPQYEIVHYPYGIDSILYLITDYSGNIETIYTAEDTLARRIHNNIGYHANGIYYHYIKDHLGNICAVVNSEADTLVQSTIYYASGVPMAENLGQDVAPSYYMAMGIQYTENFGRDKQPYLYNGKEFVEAHGLNEYEYGFRNYYSPIGRFTSIDPLAESTPWQSPYAYANNNFINAVDWMGLSGLMSGYSSTYNLTCVNGVGDVVYHKDSWDTGVYRVDDDWEEGDLLLYSMLIGREIPGIRYIVGECCDFWLNNGDYFSGSLRSAIAVDGRGYTWQFGFAKDNSNNALSVLSDLADFSALTIGLGSDLKCNSLWWIGKNGELYFDYQRHLPGGYARSYKIAEKAIRPLGDVARGLAKISIVLDIAEIAYSQEIKPSNIVNMGMAALTYSVYLSWVPIVYGVVDITLIVTTGKSVSDRIDDIGTIKF